jgi:hypothetical protein
MNIVVNSNNYGAKWLHNLTLWCMSMTHYEVMYKKYEKSNLLYNNLESNGK